MMTAHCAFLEHWHISGCLSGRFSGPQKNLPLVKVSLVACCLSAFVVETLLAVRFAKPQRTRRAALCLTNHLLFGSDDQFRGRPSHSSHSSRSNFRTPQTENTSINSNKGRILFGEFRLLNGAKQCYRSFLSEIENPSSPG